VLVIDANVAAAACGGEGDGFKALGDELASEPLMWSEARSSLHLKLHKGEIGREDAEIIHARLESCPVERMDPPNLGAEAWRIAEEMGWGRTYDAEYVALATLLGCRLVTLDGRLRRGADRRGMVVTPSEL
jgi:predicted nucleic acid-binding protein